jgi:Ribonuclease G/E
MMYDVLYEACPWHSRVALFDPAGRLMTVHYDDALRPFLEGAVILSRVKKIVPGLSAAFVDIGDSEDGFLPLNTLPKDQKLTEGQELMVRITRAPTDGKGARLDARVLTRRPQGEVKVPSVVTPAPKALSRTLMDAGDNPVRVWMVDSRFREELLPFAPETSLFDLSKHSDVDLLEQVDTQIEQAWGPRFDIPGGGHIFVEFTRALTSIDVDSGHMLAQSLHLRALDVNKVAAAEIYRICHLLELGGTIVVDFITMFSKKDRADLQDYVTDLFKQDMTDVEVGRLSRFGVMEINRKRVGENLMVRLRWPMYVAGEILLKLWRKPIGRGARVEAVPEVISILKARLSREAALAYLGAPVELVERSGRDVENYILTTG